MPDTSNGQPRIFGLEPRDATEEDGVLEIPIRRRHVNEASPSDPDHCILQIAAKSIRGIKEVRVGASFVYIVYHDDPGVAVRYQIAQKSKGLTRTFDANSEEIKRNPILFTSHTLKLIPPAPSQRLGARSGERSGSDVRGTGKRRNVHHAKPTRSMTFTSAWEEGEEPS